MSKTHFKTSTSYCPYKFLIALLDHFLFVLIYSIKVKYVFLFTHFISEQLKAISYSYYLTHLLGNVDVKVVDEYQIKSAADNHSYLVFKGGRYFALRF